MGLRKALFGPTYVEAWRDAAPALDAELVNAGRLKGWRLVTRTAPWTITIDQYQVSAGGPGHATYTRLRAPFMSNDGFRFALYRSGPLSGLGKLLGMQDLEIGDLEFDRIFIVKANDPLKVRDLFSDPRLRELTFATARLRLEIHDDEGRFVPRFPEGTDELRLVVPGLVKDAAGLGSLKALCAQTLAQLRRIGTARYQDPVITL